MSTAIITSAPLAGGAIETRGGWTWSFPCDLAGAASWAALNGGVGAALALSGHSPIGQDTPGLGAPGAGSARIDRAVLGGVAVQWLSGANYPNPVSNKLLFRLILRDPRIDGTATYLELSQAAQQITIRRNGSNLELSAIQTGTYTETVDLTPFAGGYLLLDVFTDPAAGTFRAFINGIDLTPSFVGAGGVLAAFAGNASLALLNNIAGTDPALDVELVFAGIATSPTLTFDQHRDDASALEAREEGVAIEGLGGFTWAWSPNRFDGVSLPGEPDFGALSATLAVSSGVMFNIGTGPLLSEGLGRPRLRHAFSPGSATDRVYRGPPSGFPIVDGDLHLRLIAKLLTPVATQRLFSLGDFEVAVDASGGLILSAPSGYSVTLPAAVAFNRWHLIDISLDRDNGSGDAQFVVQIDGLNVSASAFAGPVVDIPADTRVVLFDDEVFSGAAVDAIVVFAGLTRGRVLPLAQHVIGALALGVVL